MVRLSRWAKLAAGAGGVVFVLTVAVLPRALVWAGHDPRTAAGECMTAGILLAPGGVLALGLFGLSVQGSSMPASLLVVVAIAVGTIANAALWAAIVEAFLWSRVRARWLFWTLMLGVLAYWVVLLGFPR